ncbi:MAG: ABC transporter permease [Streptosporangiales bacterium]|nr:ABC transporter permease [Streptosporangiales bacterium]
MSPGRMIWLIARREIRVRGKSRAFVITIAILLVAVALAVVLPAVLSGPGKPTKIGVVGGSRSTPILIDKAALVSRGKATQVPEPSQTAAEAALRAGRIDAALVSGREIIVKQVPFGGESGVVGTLAQLGGLNRLIQTVPGAAGAVSRGIALPVRGLEPPSTPLSSRLTGLAVVIIVWILISVYGQQIAQGIGEEKGSRVIEVLLSSVRPVQLLLGKVIGIGALALAQAAAMVAVFVIAGFAVGSDLVHGAELGVVIGGGVFMVLGYSFYCTAYAAAGSLVSRQSDVGATVLPVQLPLIIAYALSYTVLYSPHANVFYHVLGFLPPTAPIAMTVLYAAGDVPAWQLIVSMVICAAGTVWMARLAARIYTSSILKTGPKIGFREALRAARATSADR